jgi:uncharacterized protein (TIGR02246 family)
MKKRQKVLAVVFAGIFLGACQQQTPQVKTAESASTAETTPTKSDPKTVEEIREVLAKHDKALNDQNLDALMGTFSSDNNTVVLGTGKGERFVWTDAIRQAYTEIFKDYDKGTLVTSCDWKTGGADDAAKMAWLAATCNAADSMKNVKRDYVLNVSAAVVKQDNGWRFVMLHMSNATAGAPPPAAKS